MNWESPIIFKIVIGFPPSSLSGHAKGNGHWGKSSVTKKWRKLAFQTSILSQPPKLCDAKAYTQEGDIKIHISFYPPDKRGDRVNFSNRMKPIFDGIADALGVNDSRFVPYYEYFEPDRENPRVEIRIIE